MDGAPLTGPHLQHSNSSLRQIESGRDIRWFFEQGRRGSPFWTGIPFMVYGAEWINGGRRR